MFKKTSALLSVITSLSLGLTGCTLNGGSTKESKDKIPLTVAEVTHSIFYAPQYVAISEGFFEEEGIEIDLINTQGADKTMAALLSGEADIGLMGPEASIYVSNQSKDNYAVNFAQLTKVYGKEDGDTIRGNCNLLYLISSEIAALEEISKMCGEVKSKEKEKR